MPNSNNERDNFYKEILDNLTEGVYFVDTDRKITYWNRGAEGITGFQGQQVIGHSCADNLLMHVDDAGTLLCQYGCPLSHTLHDGEVHEAQVYLHHRNGHRVPVRVRVAPLRNQKGEITGAVESFSDNTSMLAALKHADELKEAAFQDPLTGVGNRRFIEMKLVSSLAEFKQHGLALALLFLDVDDFKKVNDTFGHEIGDRVLQMVANTLRHNIRSFDWLGRWGGEEFVIVLLNVDEDQVESIANKLRALVASSNLPAEQGDMQVTVSVGATLIRPDDTLETLVQRADNLMYQSKKSGKNRVTFSI